MKNKKEEEEPATANVIPLVSHEMVIKATEWNELNEELDDLLVVGVAICVD